MNIAILSRGPQLYSTQSLAFAGRMRRHHVRIIDYLECNIIIEANAPQLYYLGEKIEGYDAIIPRIGNSATYYGSSVIKHFELMNVLSTLGSEELLVARNKLRSLQMLSTSGLGIPKTIFTNLSQDVDQIVESIGLPLIIKLLRGTHGLGVILCDKKSTAVSTIEAFTKLRERVLIQEFIAESKGADIRAFVVDGEVIGAMKRQAQPGEFRSNLHRGGTSEMVDLTEEEHEAAVKATKILGLHVAGVDMLQSARGPLILEVNPSPGLEGITKTTGEDIAGKIIEFLERNVGAGVLS